MNRFITVILLICWTLLLSSCAYPSKAKREAKLQAWIGKSAQHLIQTKGEPDTILKQKQPQQTYVYQIYVYRWHYVAKNGEQFFCSTHFTIDFSQPQTHNSNDGVITGWSHQGNHCISD